MKRSHSVRIKAPKGQMVVRRDSRERRSVGYLVRCPKQDAHLYELMPEDEARALEKQWQEEDRKKREESMTPSEPPHTDPNDSTRT